MLRRLLLDRQIKLTWLLYFVGMVGLPAGISVGWRRVADNPQQFLSAAAFEALAMVAFGALFVRGPGVSRAFALLLAIVAGGFLAHFAHQFIDGMQALM